MEKCKGYMEVGMMGDNVGKRPEIRASVAAEYRTTTT